MKDRDMRPDKISPIYRTMAALLTENVMFLRNARREEDRLATFEGKELKPEQSTGADQSRRAHAETLENLRKAFTKLSEPEKTKFRALFAERKTFLLALQPKDEKTADADEKESVHKLEDLKYLGKTLGFPE